MKERAFRADAREAKGLHDGTVTCLVRVVDPQPDVDKRKHRWGMALGADGILTWGKAPWRKTDPHNYIGEGRAVSPFGVVGDRLWVQEEWALIGTPHGPRVVHSGERVGALLGAIFDDEETGEGVDWQPAETMRRESCRTILDVTDVRVARAQEVPGQDMRAAGMTFGCRWCTAADACAVGNVCEHPRDEFREAVGRAVFDANKWLWLATVAKVEA